LNYQFGLTQSPGLAIAQGYVSSPTTTKGQNISARSGLKLSRDLRFTFSHAYRTQENVGSSSTGSNEQTMFWLSSKGAGVKAYPFVDVTADMSGLERIPFLSKVTRSVSLSSGLSNRMQENWQDNSSNVTTRNYTQQWNPLLGVNVSWKAELESNIRYSSSRTFADNVTSRSKGRQSDNQLTATVTYTFRTGFKLPLLFMRPVHLQNQTSFSLNGDYRKQRNESTETGSDAYVVRGATSSWSLQPRVTYTFSNTVQGQAFVQVQQTKNDVTQSKSRLFEFGIQVTISIRG
jgi:cell surface protein SprA